MKVDYQKQVKSSAYKFHPIHLKWLGLHIPASAMLFYIVAIRLPDGKSPINPIVCGMIGLIVFSVTNVFGYLNAGKPSQLPQGKETFLEKYRVNLTKVILVCLLSSAILSGFVPALLWKYGAGICLLIAVCLWGFSKIAFDNPKRIIIQPVTAMLYTLGIWASPMISQHFKNLETKTLSVIFFLLTLQIIILISHFEALDRNTTPNLARWLGKPRTRYLTYIITILVCLTCISLCLKTEFRFIQRLAVIFIVITCFQLSIFIKSGKVDNRLYLKLAAEMSILFPILLL